MTEESDDLLVSLSSDSSASYRHKTWRDGVDIAGDDNKALSFRCGGGPYHDRDRTKWHAAVAAARNYRLEAFMMDYFQKKIEKSWSHWIKYPSSRSLGNVEFVDTVVRRLVWVFFSCPLFIVVVTERPTKQKRQYNMIHYVCWYDHWWSSSLLWCFILSHLHQQHNTELSQQWEISSKKQKK